MFQNRLILIIRVFFEFTDGRIDFEKCQFWSIFWTDFFQLHLYASIYGNPPFSIYNIFSMTVLQIELVLKFLQKAALSLREPYYLKAPSAKLSGKDRVKSSINLRSKNPVIPIFFKFS